MGLPVSIPVRCTATFADGESCTALRWGHVHEQTPCVNGQDARHHEFVPPKSVTVLIEGRKRRLKVPA